MGTEKSIKECKFCFSEIDSRAKKCPNCQVFQGSWIVLVPGVVILPILFIILLIWAISPGRSERVDQSSAVSLVDSRLYIGVEADPQFGEGQRKVPSVVGSLRNNGEALIDYIELEVHVFDDQDKLVDVFRESVSGPFASGEEYAYKVIGSPIHTTEAKYTAHTVVVRSAHSW